MKTMAKIVFTLLVMGVVLWCFAELIIKALIIFFLLLIIAIPVVILLLIHKLYNSIIQKEKQHGNS